jgi:hypothetical protein
MKLGHKDYTIAVKTGTDANKAKFKKECVQGEIYHATDTGFFYIAEVTAGLNDATLSKFGATAFQNQYSVSFDGSDDYVDTGSTFQSTIRGGFTYSLWLKLSSLGDASSYMSPFGSWDDSADQNGFYISNAVNNGNLTFRLEVGTAKITCNATPASGWNTSDWFHILVAVEQDSSNVVGKMYIDGVYKISSTMSATLTNFVSNRSIYVGARNRTSGSNLYFPGLIDEAAIFDSALSDGGVSIGAEAGGDIGDIYNDGVPNDLGSDGLNLSPVGWWRMGDNDGGTGTTITDQGSGGNNGTLTNGPTFSTSVPS